MSTLFNLKVEGQEDVRVICRGVPRDVVKDLPRHIDLMRLKRTSRVKLFIPVEFVNAETCPGLKKGGTLTVVRNEVELDVLAGDIPDHLTIDLASHEMGDTIHISEVTMPEGAKSVIDRDFVIANIAAPRTMAADDDEEGTEDAAAEEAPAEE